MKIAYIELDTHGEIARNFMDLTKDQAGIQVDFYFSARVLSFLGLSPSAAVHRSGPELLWDQLQNGHYDLVLIGTAHRYFNLFLKIQKTFPTYTLVHNLNFCRRSAGSLLGSVLKKDARYRLKLLLKEALLKAPKVFDTPERLLVLDSDLQKGAIKSMNLFYTKSLESPENSSFCLVIPGEVSQKRRDYRGVLRKLKAFGSVGPIKSDLSLGLRRIHVVFLGRAQGRELKWLESLKHYSNLDVEFFTHKVSDSHFEMVLQKADLIWCPLHKKTKFFSGDESYGETKMTGAIGDAIKFNKPIVLPSFYKSSCPLVRSVDLQSLSTLDSFTSGTNVDPSFYSKAEVSERLKRFLLDLI